MCDGQTHNEAAGRKWSQEGYYQNTYVDSQMDDVTLSVEL